MSATNNHNDHLLHQLGKLERNALEFFADSSHSLADNMAYLLMGLEAIFPEMLGSVLLLLPDQSVTVLSAPSIPSTFSSLLEGQKIGPHAGSCGTAMFTGETIIVEDIATSVLWKPYRTFTLNAGLAACWSVPLKNSDGKVMASFAMYHRRPKSPSPEELNAVIRISFLARVILENKLSAEEIRSSNTRYELINKATSDLIWDWDIKKGKVYRNPEGLQKVFGWDPAKPLTSEEWFKRLHPDDAHRVRQSVEALMQNNNGESFHIEYRFQNDEGGYEYVLDRGYVIRDSSGAPLRFIGAAQNISDRKKLEQELVEQEINKRRQIALASIEGQENERKQLAVELHENINQILSTSKLLMDMALDNPAQSKELITKSRENVEGVINEIKRITSQLAPTSIEDLGMREALQELIDQVAFKYQIQFQIKLSGKIQDIPSSLNRTLFRIVQEQISNICKHSGATEAVIALQKKRGEVVLEILDNGKGFRYHANLPGAGLRNIGYRVELNGGRFLIKSSPGKGCSLISHFPIWKSSGKPS